MERREPRPEAAEEGGRARAAQLFPHALSILEGGFPLRLLAVGDSIPWGAGASTYGMSFARRWADHLRSKYNVPVYLVNATAPGLTTDEFRIESRYAARQLQPDLTVLSFGINDQRHARRRVRRPQTWRGGPAVPLNRFTRNLTMIAESIMRASGGDVVLLTPIPIPGLPHNDEYRRVVERIAERGQFALADVASVWTGDELLTPDRQHPNDEGHALYLNTLLALGL